ATVPYPWLRGWRHQNRKCTHRDDLVTIHWLMEQIDSETLLAESDLTPVGTRSYNSQPVDGTTGPSWRTHLDLAPPGLECLEVI
ncbi:MAG: hypothetical protein HY318_20310, partial [Armatimonadetes bacterium]|nr:hypothetical protein [Armatimonadota bacterium]